MEKLSDLKSFKHLSSQPTLKSAGGALNLTRELHDLVAEDISCLEQERDYDTMLKLYEFIVDRLHMLKSRTSGGVKGFLSASLDYWKKMLDEKKPELEKRKEKEALSQGQSSDKWGRSENKRIIITLRTVRPLNSGLKRRSEKMPFVKKEQKINKSFADTIVEIGLASETNDRRVWSERTEQGGKIVSLGRVEIKPTVSRRRPSIEQLSVKPSQSAKQLSIKE